MAEGFLGRWSERKRALAAGQPVAEPELKVAPDPAPPPTRPVDPMPPAVAAAPPQPVPAPLTLEDAQALTPQSDFKPFVAPQVPPEVRNAAMKQLFTDPHFNVMDRLDTYIDDYSQPDPLPESMLRQMVSAHFMGLFDDQPDPQKAAREPPAQPLSLPPDPPSPDHAHPDLRLQPNHATGPQEPGDGAQ